MKPLALFLIVPVLLTAENLTGNFAKDSELLRTARERGWLIRSDSPKITSSDSGDRRKGDFRYYWNKLRHGSIETEPTGSDLRAYFANQDFNWSPKLALEKSKVTISATGDLMFQKNIGKKESEHPFGTVGDFLFDADFVTANLEAPINFDKRQKDFPRFNLNRPLFETLTSNGSGRKLDLVATANNHMFDGGIGGVIRTKEILDSCGIISVGTARSADEQNRFPIVNIKGIKTAFLSYGFGCNRVVPPSEPFYGNLVKLNDIEPDKQDFSLIFSQIDSAKARGAEAIWINLHWGAEWELFPPVRNVELAHKLAERGATVIIGHHPHCLQPMERFVTADGRETFIAYSLGNLTFNYHWIEPAKSGGVVHVELVRTETGTVAINDVKFMATYDQMRARLGDGIIGFRSRIWSVDEAVTALKSDSGNHFNKRNRKEIMLYAHQVHSILTPKNSGSLIADQAHFSTVESELFHHAPEMMATKR